MGRFVVIEGIDGAGTTTQAARVTEALRARGDGVVQTAEPTDGPIGRLLRRVLRQEQGAPDPASLPWLFAADRADHLANRVVPALAEGGWVVSDRYVPSSLAYQSLERPMEDVAVLNAAFPLPDVTVMLDVPVDVALARVLARGGVPDRFERRDTLERVASAYDQALAWVQARGGVVVRLDGTRPIFEVTASILGALPGAVA